MADKIYVKPRARNPKKPDAGQLRVRRPDGRRIPAEGAWVARDTYIRRRMRDGDLVEAKPPAKKKTASKSAGNASNSEE